MNNIKGIFTCLTVMLFMVLSGCMEHYSDGDRIGYITKYSTKGVLFKTHEAHMNVTQTGMNSSEGFDFSIENNDADLAVQQAANQGYKVKVIYHQLGGLANFLNQRGETEYFVTQVIRLDSIPKVSKLPQNVATQ